MTPQDAARIMSSLHGAFPYASIDDDIVRMWSNALDIADADVAELAVERWVSAETFWPSIAAFNGVMTEIRREQRGETERPLVDPRMGAIRCNGDGWFDRGEGMEPCPACNPWMRQRWRDGRLDHHARPPTDFIQPEPCAPSHIGEGPTAVNRHRAMQLVLVGLREQLAENGMSPDEIDEAVKRRMPSVLAAVGAVPETSPHDDD